TIGLNRTLSIFILCLSSRSRHTISKRDWSSDVCSSDLAHPLHGIDAFGRQQLEVIFTMLPAAAQVNEVYLGQQGLLALLQGQNRSEERRVGKEGRTRR